MPSEVRENAEARTTPAGGVEAGRLLPSAEDMAGFWQSMKLAGSAAERERAMFASGFHFESAESLYGGSGAQIGKDSYPTAEGIIGQSVGASPMTDEKPKNEGDRLIIKPELLTAPEAQRSGVIGDNGNQARWEKAQEVHNLGDNSATGLFYPAGKAPATEKFGIVGLDDKAPKKNANGTAYTVYTQEAGQALTPIGQIHKPLTEGAHQSAVKLNVGVTQVPEVTTGVTPQDALKYTSTVMEAGAQAVRQTEEHLAKPGAVNRDLLDMALAGSKLPGYLTNTEQLQKDVKSLITGAAQKVEEVVQTIDKPMTPEQRAKMAGTMLPLFFFEGANKPIDKKVVQQMKLEQMTEEELKALGIERKADKIADDLSTKKNQKPAEITSEALENPPVLANGQPLVFDSTAPVEVRVVKVNNPKAWDDLGRSPRGKEFHQEMGENLPTNHKGIDNWDAKNKIATSFKTRDLRTDSYNSYKKLYESLETDLTTLERWDGKITAGDLNVRPRDIRKRCLDIGIPDGVMTAEQKQAIEDISRLAAQKQLSFRITVIQ